MANRPLTERREIDNADSSVSGVGGGQGVLLVGLRGRREALLAFVPRVAQVVEKASRPSLLIGPHERQHLIRIVGRAVRPRRVVGRRIACTRLWVPLALGTPEEVVEWERSGLAARYLRRIFSMALPLASSSMSLSK